jgi:GNAT superfamily N-acetyltransferase
MRGTSTGAGLVDLCGDDGLTDHGLAATLGGTRVWGMGFEIRVATPADAAGIAAVWAAALPYLVKTAKGIEAELKVSKSRVVLIAVEGDSVVGYGNVYLPAADAEAPRVRITVHVSPAARNRGIGSALAEAISGKAEEMGARSLLIVVTDDEASKTFAVKRGFTIDRPLSHARADLSLLPEPAAVPDDLRLIDYGSADPRKLWEATAAVADGDPSGLSDAPEYDDWFATEWNHPDLRRDLSIALLDGDQVVSFVTTTADPARKMIWSNLTGTVPAYRGRGLAKVVKSVALARSRDAGFTDAFTGNDADNRPMLAVNRWLGYQPTASSWTAAKAL